MRRSRDNWPTTLDNPLFERWPHLAAHGGRPAETAGAMLLRIVERRPDPLPERFLAALAVTVVADPSPFGRIVLHALRAAEAGDE